MVRRLSALFFLLGMMVLVLFQQPALAYCGHSDQFFITDCGCQEPVETGCPHCREEKPVEPCDDCSEKIALDVDELIWFELSPDRAEFVSVPFSEPAPDHDPFFSESDLTIAPIRPPPPLSGVSLFLLFSVFRL